MNPDVLALLVLGIAIVFALSIPIVYMLVDYHKRRRLIELYHAERMAAIERGMDLPPLALEIVGPAPRKRSSALLPGLIWLFVGIGIVLSLEPLADEDGVELLGLIPAGVGVAYLIYYFAEGRKQLQREPQAPATDAPREARASHKP